MEGASTWLFGGGRAVLGELAGRHIVGWRSHDDSGVKSGLDHRGLAGWSISHRVRSTHNNRSLSDVNLLHAC